MRNIGKNEHRHAEMEACVFMRQNPSIPQNDAFKILFEKMKKGIDKAVNVCENEHKSPPKAEKG